MRRATSDLLSHGWVYANLPPTFRRSIAGLSQLGSRVAAHPPRTTWSVPKRTTSSIWTHITPDLLFCCGSHLRSLKMAPTKTQNLRASTVLHHPPPKEQVVIPAPETTVRMRCARHITKLLFPHPDLRILTAVGNPIWTNANLECLLARYYRVSKRTWTHSNNTT